MSRIVVIVECILDGRSTDSIVPGALVVTSNEQNIIQIARVGHGVFLVGQSLVNEVAKFSG